jgi:ATP-dependent 26S proteasome regulatory subunit
MDKQTIRAQLETAFATGDKASFIKLIGNRFSELVVEAMWDVRHEMEDLSKSAAALHQLSERIEAARRQPGIRGRCLEVFPDDRKALVRFGGVREEMTVSPQFDMKKLRPGAEVLIQGGQSGGRTIVDLREDTGFDGCVITIAELLGGSRAIVDENGSKVIAQIADGVECSVGNTVRYDPVAHLVLEVLERGETATLQLEGMPKHTFDDIGGLVEQKLQLRERLIYPIIYKETFQKYGLDVVKGALLHGPPGCGKAQPLDAEVITPFGHTKMGEVTVGDLVSTPDGNWAKVTKVFPQGEKDIYRVFFSDRTSTECCEDHLWRTSTKNDRDAGRPGSIKTLRQIISSLKYGTDKRRNHLIPMTKPVKFLSDAVLPLDPYLVGVLLGDGCLSGRTPVMTTGDLEMIEYVCKLLPQGMVARKILNSKYDFRLVHGGLRNSHIENKVSVACKNLGIMGCRSWEKFVPQPYKVAPVKTRIALLQGLLDTDGTTSTNGCGTSFASSSERLANDVKFVVESLGGKATISTKNPHYSYKGCKLAGRKSFVVFISLPSNIAPFRLERKCKRHIPHSKYQPARFIDHVEYVGKKQAQCILIDHPQHMYLTNNFIVTHNTLLAGAIFNEMRTLRSDTAPLEGFFVISGPECLSEWTGRTERTIREVFQKARAAADKSGLPSVIFWDELESLAATRRDSPTYMPEKTVVPTLLSELQGLEEHKGVVFLAATNRPDLVDPALLRPGRLGDVIVMVPRPDKVAGAQILTKHFRGVLPKALMALVDHGLVEKIIGYIYDTDRPLAAMRRVSGDTIGVLRRDLVSGALLAQISKEFILSACLSEICGKQGPTMDDGIVIADRLMVAQVMAQTTDSGGSLPTRRLQTGGLSG